MRNDKKQLIIYAHRHIEPIIPHKTVYGSKEDYPLKVNTAQTLEKLDIAAKTIPKQCKRISSPSPRAIQTELAILERQFNSTANVNFSVDERVDELNLGSWVGRKENLALKLSALPRFLVCSFNMAHSLNLIKNGVECTPFPKGENIRTLNRRALNVIQTLNDQHKRGEILNGIVSISTHSGFMRALESIATGKSFTKLDKPDYLEVRAYKVSASNQLERLQITSQAF